MFQASSGNTDPFNAIFSSVTNICDTTFSQQLWKDVPSSPILIKTTNTRPHPQNEPQKINMFLESGHRQLTDSPPILP